MKYKYIRLTRRIFEPKIKSVSTSFTTDLIAVFSRECICIFPIISVNNWVQKYI